MTPLAVVMMVVAIAIIWGGLTAAILYLRRHPAPHGGGDAEYPAGVPDVTDPTRSAHTPGHD